MLENGEKYTWTILHKAKKFGTFTGEYAKNGDAIFIDDEDGGLWYIPEEQCTLVK